MTRHSEIHPSLVRPRNAPFRAVLLGCLFGLACGPKDPGDETATAATTGQFSGTGGVDETAAPTEPAATGGSPTTDVPVTTGGATTDATGATTGDVCSALEDAVPGPGVQISLHNAGSEAVFLVHAAGCAAVPLIDVAGPDADTPIQWTHDICQITCGQALIGACACPPFCPADAILMIAPGGTHTFPWDGAVFHDVALPLECAAECADSCLKVEQAAAGDYSLVARASTSAVACADPSMCTCEPNQEGWCDVQASGIGADLRLAEGTLDYPNTQTITLMFTD